MDTGAQPLSVSEHSGIYYQNPLREGIAPLPAEGEVKRRTSGG
jgi:hypothetical protein